MVGAQVIWDLDNDPTGNVQHIAQHGVMKDEVVEVLCAPGVDVDESRSSGYPAVFGWTTTGRFLIVVFELVCDDPLIVYPITSYDVPPPVP